MDIEQLLTGTTYSDQYDLIRHLDAQTERAFTLMETASIQATRQMAEPADFQAPTLTSRGRIADVAVVIEAMVTAAQANGENELAELLGTAAETADDLLILLARAAHGTLPATADAGEDEDQEDGEQDEADEPVAA
ncbi:hypothetical protein ABZ135_32700 [Streptomyces sp. NPDC006339]|uniref:hypothetical protein n=1 Tax=Streptomyces sp. NPDC006339 TaxID=3156755 RepID=UPI0033A8D60E